MFDKLFILFRIAFWPSAEKELSPWLSARTVYFVPSKLYVFLSRLVFGASCGICLYPFLIIVISSIMFIFKLY